jgi:hypothetical protein
MKAILAFSVLVFVAVLSCATDEEPLFSHVYGYMRYIVYIDTTDSDTIGVNNLVVRIRDLDPDDLNRTRERSDTTITQDLFAGYFEMDSVCYGTAQRQGTGYVTVIVDTVNNPAWPNQLWLPTIEGPVDTLILYLED